ncbi:MULTISPECIES: polymorphic toxin-type HINT domain-containing protein [Isoptericola]|uniref:polymorphic toxin-type HINT domain-containing protein n=1 Tax=Isoptericola TaxID=254250 RepID=UPI000D050F96|nr:MULTISPECIES: polymorphic toxin-type HINT domain-containing protein [Isoptericola]
MAALETAVHAVGRRQETPAHAAVPIVVQSACVSKPIEDIRLGDQVLATDETTGKSGPQDVVALITGEGHKDLVSLTVTDHNGDAGTVTATGGHPFWVPTLREWVDAGDLRPGQWLQTGAGTRVQLTATETTHEYAQVHNLTVAGTHTYYVDGGNLELLSHSTSCRTFDHLSPSGRLDVSNMSGVYKIEMGDGRAYVGKATDIHGRIHGSFRRGGALNDEGYCASEVRGLDWIEMPGASSAELFEMEAGMISRAGGISNLANRVNSPGITG